MPFEFGTWPPAGPNLARPLPPPLIAPWPRTGLEKTIGEQAGIWMSATSGRQFTQARGRARRQALLTAARALLDERDLYEITLPAVAEGAGIPASSTYHFFADMRELYKCLAQSIADEMAALTPDAHFASCWQAAVRDFMTASCAFFNGDGAARTLMLGTATPPDIKRAACHDGYRFGAELYDMLAAAFCLPKLRDPIGVCFRAVQLADAMFSLSVAEHGKIVPEMLEEAVRASSAYLGIYLPQVLERSQSLVQVLTPARPPESGQGSDSDGVVSIPRRRHPSTGRRRLRPKRI